MSATFEPATERGFRLAVATMRDLRVSDPSASGDGSWVVSGYAATFNDEYVLYDGKWFVMRERIAQNAFDDVLERVGMGDELVHLNHGHNMESAVAATDVAGIGGLELAADSHGLRFVARVDAEDPDAVRMAAKMRRGVVSQASFAFTIDAEELLVREMEDGREDELYTILRIGHLYDVCVCAQGANPYTESSLRSLAAASLRVPNLGAHGHPPVDGGHQGHPWTWTSSMTNITSGGPIQVTPQAGQADTGRRRLAEARIADVERQLRKEGVLK